MTGAFEKLPEPPAVAGGDSHSAVTGRGVPGGDLLGSFSSALAASFTNLGGWLGWLAWVFAALTWIGFRRNRKGR